MKLAKRIFLAALIAAGLGAQAIAEGTKIGYIDVQQCAKRSATIQDKVQAAEGDIRKKQEALEIKVGELNKVKTDLQARRSVLTPDEVEKQQKKLDGLLDELEGMRREIEKLVRKTETGVMGPAVDRIMAAAKQVGKDQGFDLIISSDIVVYGSEQTNLTPLVIRELDKIPTAAPKEEGDAKPKDETGKKPDAPGGKEESKPAAKPAPKPAPKKK